MLPPGAEHNMDNINAQIAAIHAHDLARSEQEAAWVTQIAELLAKSKETLARSAQLLEQTRRLRDPIWTHSAPCCTACGKLW